MATVVSNTGEVGDAVQPRQHIGVTAAQATYAIPATGDGTAANDIIQMVEVPNGATILDLWVSSTDIDTDGTPAVVFSVGDGGDVDRFVLDSTIGQAGGVARLNNPAGCGYSYTADDTIDIKIVTVADVKAAGTIVLTVFYSTSGV